MKECATEMYFLTLSAQARKYAASDNQVAMIDGYIKS